MLNLQKTPSPLSLHLNVEMRNITHYSIRLMAYNGRLAVIPTIHFGSIYLTRGGKATLTFITRDLSIPSHIMHKSHYGECVCMYILYV